MVFAITSCDIHLMQAYSVLGLVYRFLKYLECVTIMYMYDDDIIK